MSFPADYPRCKTCKWWDVKAYDFGDYRGCLNELLNVSASEGGPVDGLNGSGFEYRTTTAPDFGCVHWEAKDTPAPQ